MALREAQSADMWREETTAEQCKIDGARLTGRTQGTEAVAEWQDNEQKCQEQGYV